MSRVIIFLCVFACVSCFNNEESEQQGFCGTVDVRSPKTEMPEIFKAKCATCHMFEKDITGPRMKGILDRVPSEAWLRAFITNQDSLIQIEDEYTLEIMNYSPAKWSHSLADLEKKELDTLMSSITQ